MKLVKFIRDLRPHYGYVDLFVNPADVSRVEPTLEGNNRSVITCRDGEKLLVTDYASIVAEKLQIEATP